MSCSTSKTNPPIILHSLKSYARCRPRCSTAPCARARGLEEKEKSSVHTVREMLPRHGRNRKGRSVDFILSLPTCLPHALMFFPDEKKQRDERNEATKKSWLRTELLQSDLVAPDPGASIIARWMYAYNEIAFAVNQWYAFQPTL